MCFKEGKAEKKKKNELKGNDSGRCSSAPILQLLPATACIVKHPFLQLFIYFVVPILNSPHAQVHLRCLNF